MDISSLTLEQEAALGDGLDLAARIAGAPHPLTPERLQSLFEIVRDEYADHEAIVIALGLAFGESMKQATSFEWVRIRDSFGEETALALPGTQVVCAPISMIQKRIGQDEAVDLEALKNTTLKALQDMMASKEYAKR